MPLLFTSDDPEYLDERFCSVEIFVPSQVPQSDGGFDLMASTWFGTVREDFETAAGLRSITVGLHSATLTIETCENSRMVSENRFRSEPLMVDFHGVRDEQVKNLREGKMGIRFTLPLLRRVGEFFGEGARSSEKSKSGSEKREQSATHPLYEVDTSSPIGWSIEALNPARYLLHLKGPEIRDETLCGIDTPKRIASVTARLFAEARDLCLDIHDDSNTSLLEDDANQRAVLAALVAKSVEENGLTAVDDAVADKRFAVAKSILHRRVVESGS